MSAATTCRRRPLGRLEGPPGRTGSACAKRPARSIWHSIAHLASHFFDSINCAAGSHSQGVYSLLPDPDLAARGRNNDNNNNNRCRWPLSVRPTRLVPVSLAPVARPIEQAASNWLPPDGPLQDRSQAARSISVPEIPLLAPSLRAPSRSFRRPDSHSAHIRRTRAGLFVGAGLSVSVSLSRPIVRLGSPRVAEPTPPTGPIGPGAF